MSTNYSCSMSVELVSYLTGELSKREIKKLEKHLLDCPSCSLELKGLQRVWKIIPYNFEQVEVPSDLKEEVMNSIFLSEDTSQQTEEQLQQLEENISKRNRRPFITFVVAAALLPTFGELIWNNLILRQEVAELKNQSQLPIKVSQV
jgi:Putative zinc-finger